MRRSPRSRETASLSDSVHHQLTMYALAASAVGVGVLALAQSADAKIVYTPARIPINVGGGLVELDLNGDGINDFQFIDTFVVEKRQGHHPSDAFSFSSFNVTPVQKSNRVYAVKSESQLCASAVPKGRRVGPHSPFQPGGSTLVMAFASDYGAAFCPWRPVKTAYLGVKFVIKGKVHFGWARIKRTVSMYAGFPAIITGYAYETIPNKPIITGKTKGPDEFKEFDSDPGASLTAPIPDKPQSATLGALAMGAAGLSIWRREVSVSVESKAGLTLQNR